MPYFTLRVTAESRVSLLHSRSFLVMLHYSNTIFLTGHWSSRAQVCKQCFFELGHCLLLLRCRM